MTCVTTLSVVRGALPLSQAISDFVDRVLLSGPQPQPAVLVVHSDAQWASRGLTRPYMIDRHFGDLHYG